ncbi:serine/threonine protein kinase [Agathobaculum desmolans]|uniref:serine/threonine protein kinase n=1 Tax=Agathobaculum desmolans TaxID=39484 RepID=UPI0039955542
MLHYNCCFLPQIMEVAAGQDEVLVLEEYIEGDTLDYLLQGGVLTAEQTRVIVTQVCQALWVLHTMGAVHRDVKPENIILRGQEAVLIDFDVARMYKPKLPADTEVLGTVGFAAPEQFGLSQSDARADIYSVGVLINVMLTGRHPSKQMAGGALYSRKSAKTL